MCVKAMYSVDIFYIRVDTVVVLNAVSNEDVALAGRLLTEGFLQSGYGQQEAMIYWCGP